MKKDTAYHEICHAVMSTFFDKDVYEISIIKNNNEDGYCLCKPTDNKMEQAMIVLAPYVFDKNFTLKNLPKYYRKSDVNQVIDYISILEDKEFEAHKTLIKMVLTDNETVIKEATDLLRKKKIIYYSDWSKIINKR